MTKKLYKFILFFSFSAFNLRRNYKLTLHGLTVLYQDYAHPNCMLQSYSYRWDGLNFENSSFALKLSPLIKKLSLFCLHLRPSSS